jgi:hypothetical protein
MKRRLQLRLERRTVVVVVVVVVVVQPPCTSVTASTAAINLYPYRIDA